MFEIVKITSKHFLIGGVKFPYFSFHLIGCVLGVKLTETTMTSSVFSRYFNWSPVGQSSSTSRGHRTTSYGHPTYDRLGYFQNPSITDREKVMGRKNFKK